MVLFCWKQIYKLALIGRQVWIVQKKNLKWEFTLHASHFQTFQITSSLWTQFSAAFLKHRSAALVLTALQPCKLVACCLVSKLTACVTSSCSSWCNKCHQTGLLLGLTPPLHPLLCQTGLMHLDGTTAEHIFMVWICVKVLGEEIASGCLWVRNTMSSISFLDTWWFSAFSLHFLR